MIIDVPGTVLDTLYNLFPFSQGRNHFPHFAIGETDIQRSKMTCSRSHVWEVATARLESWLAVSFLLCLVMGMYTCDT